MKASEITYQTDLVKDYVTGLRNLRTLSEFRSYIEGYKEIAFDAYKKIMRMDQYHFDKFMQGYAKEKSGKYAGKKFSDEYGMIILPRIMLTVGLLAQSFKVPAGAMFIRLKDMGIIKQYAVGICHISDVQLHTGP